MQPADSLLRKIDHMAAQSHISALANRFKMLWISRLEGSPITEPSRGYWSHEIGQNDYSGLDWNTLSFEMPQHPKSLPPIRIVLFRFTI